MLLSTRLKRLFHADSHALIKGLENPIALLESSIMSMEDLIENSRKALTEKQHQLATCQALLEKFNTQVSKTDEALSICLSQENEPLARHTIKRKLILEQETIKLSDRKETLIKEIETQKTALTEQHEKLDEIKLKASALNIQSCDNTDIDTLTDTKNKLIREEDISIRLLQEKHKRGLNHE